MKIILAALVALSFGLIPCASAQSGSSALGNLFDGAAAPKDEKAPVSPFSGLKSAPKNERAKAEAAIQRLLFPLSREARPVVAAKWDQCQEDTDCGSEHTCCLKTTGNRCISATTVCK